MYIFGFENRYLYNARVLSKYTFYPVLVKIKQKSSVIFDSGYLCMLQVVLIENDINSRPFSSQVLACLPPLPWTLSADDLANPNRQDLRQVRVFSVDPPGMLLIVYLLILSLFLFFFFRFPLLFLVSCYLHSGMYW